MASAEEIGADLTEAKVLLAKAKRPAVKAVLSTFIREMTKKELVLLGAADDDVSDEEPADAPMPPAPPAKVASPKKAEPKAAPASVACADLLPVAPKRTFAAAAEPALPTDVASPAPTKLVRPAGVPAAPSTGNARDWIVPGYGWEQGEYNSAWVNILIPIEGAIAAKDRTTCDFGTDTFDLRVNDVAGKNYRLVVEALDKDIVPGESKVVVKKNKVILKLKKIKGEYSYDHWADLKKMGGKAAKEKEKSRDPSAGIMDMMKDLYDNGDDNMRKIIGESMMKSQRGEKMDPADTKIPGSEDDDIGVKPDLDIDDDCMDDESLPKMPADLPKMPEMPDLSKIPGMEDFKMDGAL